MTWKDHNWKIGEKDIWGRNTWIDLSRWVEDVKMLACRVNAHQKVTAVEKPIVDGPLCRQSVSFLNNSITTHWAHEQRGHLGRDGINHMDFHSPRLTWLQLLWVLDLPIAETNTEP